MTESELAANLRNEGFSRTYLWEDGPNTHYPDHIHRMETAHIILRGEMTVLMDGEAKLYRTGDRFDVPANKIHSAVMGPHGCRYLIGER